MTIMITCILTTWISTQRLVSTLDGIPFPMRGSCCSAGNIVHLLHFLRFLLIPSFPRLVDGLFSCGETSWLVTEFDYI